MAAENYQYKGNGKHIAPPSQLSYERDLILAVSSIYGIELLADNVKICRERLFDFAKSEYERLFPNNQNEDCLASLRCLLALNIVHGDALTMEVATPRTESPIPELSEEQQAYAKKRLFFRNGVLSANAKLNVCLSSIGD